MDRERTAWWFAQEIPRVRFALFRACAVAGLWSCSIVRDERTTRHLCAAIRVLDRTRKSSVAKAYVHGGCRERIRWRSIAGYAILAAYGWQAQVDSGDRRPYWSYGL
jgi:hypothetical protein